ncbi:MAG: molybdopterin molybdotransferase MoeA [Sulfurospirillaceae bacterium]|nr:molybdopterin molybdotransferase MoeA [Sulfurospirillaceae bacterium]
MAKATSVSFEEAINQSLTLAKNSPNIEYISLFEALGRVLAEDVLCCKDLPCFNNSAMDGFAFAHIGENQKLIIKKSIFAGDVVEPCLGKNECYKIMTGAQVPSDADTIVAFEDCTVCDDNTIEVSTKTKKGNALRLRGEEKSKGDVILKKGERINSSACGILASQGITHIKVYKKLSIAVFSSGDELKEPWQSANEHQIYNINSMALIALFSQYGFEAHYCGVIPDDLEKTKQYFHAMKKYDAIITSGGISEGEADFMLEALVENGLEVLFNGISIKPGKPTMLGIMKETVVASMPGNPMAAFINAFLFLVPLLKKLQGETHYFFDCLYAKNATEFSVKSGRANVILGTLEDGIFKVFNNNKYGSGMITPLAYSTALLVTSDDTVNFKEGCNVKVIPLNAFFTNKQRVFTN